MHYGRRGQCPPPLFGEGVAQSTTNTEGRGSERFNQNASTGVLRTGLGSGLNMFPDPRCWELFNEPGLRDLLHGPRRDMRTEHDSSGLSFAQS